MEAYNDVISHLLQWISTVSQEECTSDADLATGDMLCKAMQVVHPDFAYSTLDPETLTLALEHFFQQDRKTLRVDMAVVQDPLSDEGKDMLRRVVRLMLGCAIQGGSKEQHIGTIMTLPSNTQRFLMLEIELVLSEIGNFPAPSAGKAPEAPASTLSAETFPEDGRPRETEQDAITSLDTVDLQVLVKKLRRENSAIKHENEELNEENTTLRSQMDTIQDELQNVKQSKQENTLKSEMEVQKKMMETETVLRREILEKQQKIEEMEEDVKQGQRAKVELQSTRDELDIARAEAGKLKRTQQSLDKMKQKLEDSAGLRNQLTDALKKNEELIQRSLDYDSISRKLQSIQQEVDAYKKTNTTLEITLSETKAIAKEKDDEISELIERCTLLEQNEKMAVQENQSLQQDLQQDFPGGNDGFHGATSSNVGAGLTELNPQVQEEMARLRKENERLVSELTNEGKEAFAELARTHENTERLREHFESEFRSTKKRAEALEESLHESQDACASLESAKSELEANLENTQHQLAELQRLCDDQQAGIADRDEQIEALEHRIKEYKLAIEQGEAQLADKQEELQIQQANFEKETKRQQDLHRGDLEDQETRAKNEIDQLEEQIAQRQTEHESLVAELEERMMIAVQVEQKNYDKLEKDFEKHRRQHAVSNEEYEEMIKQKDDELSRLQRDFEAFQGEHSKSNEDHQAELAGAESDLEEARQECADLAQTLSSKETQLQNYEAMYQQGKLAYAKLEQDKELLVSELQRNDAKLTSTENQLLQSKKKYQALQMQQNEVARKADGGGDQKREMREEIARLVQEKRDLLTQNDELRSKFIGSINSDNAEDPRRTREIIRSYECKLQELEKEKNTLSLGRTNEMNMRYEAERKISKLEAELEDANAKKVQLQLAVERERFRKQATPAAASPLVPDKENYNSHQLASPSPESDAKTPLKAVTGLGSSMINLLSPGDSGADNENKQECNQQ